MKRNKILGYVTTKLFEEEAAKLFGMIHKYAFKNNYGIVTFYPGKDWVEDVQQESISTLYMIDYNKIDAIIVDADRIQNPQIIADIVTRCKVANIPAIVLDYVAPDAISVVNAVEDSFREIVRHIVEDHGCKRVDFVGGYPDRYNTSQLLDIYKDVLSANGIVYDQERVVYGHYYGEETVKAFNKLMEIDVPEAIICANDTMAITIHGLLRKRGLDCPRNVLLTGIDGTIRSEYRTPAITTCKKDYESMAYIALELVSHALAGDELDSLYRVQAKTVIADSCGCASQAPADFSKHIDDLYEQKEANIIFDISVNSVSEKLAHASELEDVSLVINRGLPSNSYFCVKDSFMQDILREKRDVVNYSLSDKFFVISDTSNRKMVWKGFELSDICPDFDILIDQDIPLFVVPIHYRQVQYGYMVISEKKYEILSTLLDKYIMNFNVAFGKYVNERTLRVVNDELAYANETMRRLQVKDILTGMLNFNGFMQALEKYKLKCQQENQRLIIVCIDIDGLNNINDVYGRAEGDVAIQTVSTILSENVAEGDLCAHLGGDEFVVAMGNAGDPDKYVESFFKAFKVCISNYNAISTKDYSLDINYAFLSVIPNESTDVQALIDEAIGRKRIDKLSRRDISGESQSLNLEDEKQRLLVDDIITNNKFVYAFQPIVDARTGQIHGYEALMRTTTKEPVSPLVVINQATRDDRLYEIEYATFFNVLAKVAKFKDVIGDKKVFINSLPGYQLEDSDYQRVEDYYKDVLGSLVIEITEQTEFEEHGYELLKTRCARGGCKLAIDDYGSGYSNTVMLLNTMPDYVKIDRLLIADIHDDPNKQHFVRSIIDFAHDNGFKALAEGVETVLELRALIYMGIDLIQGYYTAMPDETIIEEIDEDIVKEIVGYNDVASTGTNKRMFIVNKEKRLFITRISLEGYNGIVVSQPELVMVGNLEYVTPLHIRIKDGAECKLTLRNVHLKSVDNMPGIELGNNSRLTLVLDDDNSIDGCGICVPHSAKLKVVGEGNLYINTGNRSTYAVGNDWKKSFGEITFNCGGIIAIAADGNKTIGIGGGIYKDGYGILFTRGKFEFSIKSENAVGIGAVAGEVPIIIQGCAVNMNLQIGKGIGIGVWNGRQEIEIENSLVDIDFKGNNVCAIGSLEGERGKVRIHSAHVDLKLNGSVVFGIGNSGGGFDIAGSKCQIDIKTVAFRALGMGSLDGTGIVSVVEGSINMDIRGRECEPISANGEGLILKHVATSIMVNGEQT